MIDEALIAEVQQHGVIYNRQKYFLNGVGPSKYESKEAAWQVIAMNLGTDVDTCKKRWKYLRERYVQQRKQCDPPTYEHLSRPYLEKMKFLDQHIQPRKSYRNVPNFLSSPNANFDYTDSSKSNGSLNNTIYQNFPKTENFNSFVKTEPIDDSFRDQQLKQQQMCQQLLQLSNFQQQQLPQQQDENQELPLTGKFNSTPTTTATTTATTTNNHASQQYRENEVSPHIPSSSSSLKSPLSSPPTTDLNESMNENSSTTNKKPRVQQQHTNNLIGTNDISDNNININIPTNNQTIEDNDDDAESTDNDDINNDSQMNGGRSTAAYQNDFLLSLYQQLPQNRIKSSEQLLGELVTSELLKMNRDKRRVAQKKILEILFFED